MSSVKFIEQELDWLQRVIMTRIQLYFKQDCSFSDILQVVPPALTGKTDYYPELLQQYSFDYCGRLLLVLSLAPHLRPEVLDIFFTKNTGFDRPYSEFGGLPVDGHGGFWPTVETAAFIWSGGDLAKRLQLQQYIRINPTLPNQGEQPTPVLVGQSGFHQSAVLPVNHIEQENMFTAKLIVSDGFLRKISGQLPYQPRYGHHFPAEPITTQLTWEDLVLSPEVMDQVEEIRAWITHRSTLLNDWQLKKKIQPGFRSLFYGPPGTGKTLTATLLGKVTDMPVYRVDLSMVVSKYIGETEKNLSQVFDQAEKQDWILFFDEADALFSKRTETVSANDRHANQEVAYLLQRIEHFPGIVLLATNLKSNIDEAFLRRFQSVIHFSMPDAEHRYVLWKGAFANPERLAANVDFTEIANEYELSGGAIINVLRYASLMALRQGNQQVKLQDIRQGIQKEFRKLGRIA
ncbi:ATP-binding protein [Spartinivicinus poritis]|uniref:ATP-binding protein n=1 Tax=Spartinivicinus poritis TaxID=2994640 RepID=A0ABT5U658_9GAMM|nr:ATP-binding protein [Spartinivicinus sp. A2-2]MDE1460679.1 ATP-binding protein [Spartinivicinus sp. A2-2]